VRRASTLQLVTIVLGWAATLASSSPAHAGNEAHLRTPVLWPSECAVIVDRSVDPVVHFDYAIPLEDTALTQEELPDSRTHQFVALCRERSLSDLLPNWITRDDVERSVAAGLLESAELAAEAILDESPLWSDCFVRVTADDDRRPITFAQAAMGFDWDTSNVAVGVWSIAGHTFEPPFNLWRDRPGFVKVVDDPADPEQDLPAIALLGEEQLLEVGVTVGFAACVDVLAPATVELEWAEWAPELIWQPLSETAVADDGPLELEFAAPSEAADREILLRARLIDALGRERLAYLPARLSILPCPAAGCVEPTTTNDPSDSGCACVTPPRPLAIGLVLLPLLLRRRRPAT
jgi:hypothetical protein